MNIATFIFFDSTIIKLSIQSKKELSEYIKDLKKRIVEFEDHGKLVKYDFKSITQIFFNNDLFYFYYPGQNN